MNLHEITAKLKARGCPDHPRLRYMAEGKLCGAKDLHPVNEWYWGWDSEGWNLEVCHPDDARAIWTQWALEWYRGITNASLKIYQANVVAAVGVDIDDTGWRPVYDTILEAIEAATRHLEAK